MRHDRFGTAGSGRRVRSRSVGAALLLVGALASCGKKGPPLEPLRLSPAPVTEISARRLGDTMLIRFTLPTTNVNGPGPVDLERVEIYAVTAAPGAVAPANRALLTRKYLVGSIPVKPAPVEGEAVPETAAKDPRPVPGETVAFTERLTEDTLKAAPLPVEPTAPPGSAAGSPAQTPTAVQTEASALEAVTRRIYAIRGLSRRSRPGPAAERIAVPLTTPPPPPRELKADFTEKAVIITWTVATGGPAIAFNVYKADDAADTTSSPLNTAPIDVPSFEQPLTDPGVEHCFAVRAVERRGNILIEGEPSDTACVIPRDIFAPAAPTGLEGVPGPGAINLIWEANVEPDLAGYVILRGEAPGETLQALTPRPIQETRYTDTTATPGVRYVYAVVAVDKASPPNMSAQSTRVEITAR